MTTHHTGTSAEPGAITPADRTRPLPLSFGQRQLWFLNRLAPDSAEYLVPLVLRLRGPLDVAALRRAWTTIVARHEILRTRHELVGDQPVQVVDPAGAPSWEVVDLADVPADDREAAARDRADTESRTPFDLEHDHPLRITLIRVHDEEHLLVAVFHHVASDQVSQQILLGELGACYHAHLLDLPVPLPEPAVQYADFAAWQQDWFSPERVEPDLRYWREKLANPPRLELPTDRPRPAVRGWAGAAVEAVVPAATAKALRDLAISRNATSFMLLLTAFQCYLARITGQDDITVGTVVSGRTDPGLAGTLGYLIDNLVLRASVDADQSFVDFLVANRGTVLDAFDHRDVPFARLVDDLQPERDLSITPLFQAAFTTHELPPGPAEVAGVRIEHVEQSWQVAKVDLALRVADLADGSLGTVFEYATVLFDRATVERMAGHFTRFLTAIAADPGTSVGALDFLSAEERSLLLGRSDHPVPTPDRALHELFADHVVGTPDATAVVAGEDRLSYAELDGRANRLAHHLRSLGVDRGDLVGVSLDRDGDLVPALLGVTKSGAAYLPLDPAYPADRLGFMIADARVRVVVTTSRHLEAVRAVHSGQVVLLDDDALTAHPATVPEVASEPGDLAYVIYTSGSTGRPKGVRVTHANVARLFTASDRHLGFGPHDTWSLFHSYSFDVSVWELWGALLHGGTLVVVPFAVSRSPEDFLALLVDNGVTVLSQTPSAFRGLVALANDERWDHSALRAVVFAGEKLEPVDLAPWVARFGLDRPELVNMYGITETTVHSTFHRLTADDLLPGAPNRVGFPLDDLTIRLLDRAGRLVPLGVTGEIHVGGPGVTAGYLDRPELTAQRFVPDPFGPADAVVYRSGDLARRLPDGSLEFLGRSDRQVKLRGFRIELGEITAALTAVPGVREAVVVLREDRPGDKRLVAYLVGEQVPDPAALREALGATLPEHMVPAAFVGVAAIPLTPNGKLDERALPAPDETAMRGQAEVVAPRTPTEARLAAVFRDVLEVGAVGVHDGFFDLGGDSIRAVSLVGSLRVGGFDVSVRDVFEHRTVARLAEFVDGLVGDTPDVAPVERFALISEDDRAALPADVVDAYPMTRLQVVMLVEMLASNDDATSYEKAGNHYHNVSSFKVKDSAGFDPDALFGAAAELVRNHEILRTSLHLEGFSTPMQLVREHAVLETGHRDLRGLSRAEAEASIREWTVDERRRSFDLGRPSLLRYFAHVVDDGWWVSITECHPILEGWSFHTLLMRLLTAYFELQAGKPVSMPPPPTTVRFADAVAAELTALESTSDREYWRDLVRGTPKLELPATWASDEPVERYRLAASITDLMTPLRDVARRADVPLKAVTHAAYLSVLAMLTDEERFTAGIVCDTRPELLGADRVAGLYLNTVPFTFDREASTWRELVKRTFAGHVEMWPHRRFPLHEMHREVGATTRLVDTFFIYLDFHVVDADMVEHDTVMDDSPNEFDLTITNMRDALLLDTNTGVLSRANGERLLGLYRAVLEAMVADLDGDAHATFLAPAERELLLHGWNRTDAPLPSVGVVEQVRAVARRTPDAIAVVDDREALTYRELVGRASAVSARLDLPVGSVVPVLADAGAGFVTAVLGVLGAGCAYIPLDTDAPAARIGGMLADSGASVVLVAPEYLGLLTAATADRPVTAIVLDDAAHAENEWVPPLGDEQDLAYVIYTSGSTGAPKGAMVHRRGMANHLLAKVEDLELTDADSVVQNAPLTFDVSVWQMLAPLIVGGRVRAVTRVTAADPSALFSLVDKEDVAILEVVPSLLRAALDDWDAGAPLPDLTGLRRLVVTGEALPPSLCVRWFARFPGVPMVNAYGPTECSDDVTHAFLAADTPFDRPLTPIGRPIRNTRLYVLGPRRHPVPIGIPGELYVGGAGVGRGYLNDPATTARAFVDDPFEPGLLYRTGDRVRYRADGQLEFLGRRDNQVKIRGRRVELGEVEAALLAVPGVRDAAAAIHADRLVGYLVGSVGPEAVRSALAVALPEHLVPTALVPLAELPLTPNGKVDRKALPAPGRAALAGGVLVPARTPEEVALAEVWRTVLKLDDVGVEDDFFAVGGDSIRTLTLVSAMRVAGFPFTVRDVFEHRTIARLAGAGTSTVDGRSLVWLNPGGGRDAVYCAHPQGGGVHWFVGLADAIGADRPVGAFEAPDEVGRGPVDLAALAARYLAEITGSGPLHLVSWSSGATLAWEMARQLEDAGRPASSLVLIDPTGDPTGAPQVATRDVLSDRIAAVLATGVSVDDPELRELLAEAGVREVVLDRDALVTQIDRMRELAAAMSAYRYPVGTTPVHLVISDECAVDHPVRRGFGYERYLERWRELAAGGVTVHRVEGDHHGVLAAPDTVALLDGLGVPRGDR
ncbi:amino acid adenylation domain-containing protein [Actinosynnema sp. NPDC020468]|uniref:amino acid adenylation domain-containing protein n=1 Tax=Actinosynnema sp. NPDC020468 TaxID=3154488 RepID=UPI0033FBA6B9